MAITFDKSLGSATAGPSFTTTNAAAANALVVVCFSFFDNTSVGTPSCTVGGTTATLDKQNTNSLDVFCIFSLVLSGSGLASGSTISCTVTGGGGLGGNLLTACSYLGTTGLDTTASNTTTGTSFSSGSATNSVADALFVGGAGNETTVTSVGGTNTNGTSRFDIWNSGQQQGMRMLDLIASSIGAQALTGTWASSSTATTGALAIYKGTASGAGPQPRFQAIPFMAPQGGLT